MVNVIRQMKYLISSEEEDMIMEDRALDWLHFGRRGCGRVSLPIDMGGKRK